MPDALIHLTGNLGGEPELRFTQNGTPVCSASVAVNKNRKIANTGDPRQDFETVRTTWYRVSWWREIAEAVAQMNLQKGQAVTIDGEVYEEEYTTRDGQAGKSLQVTAHGVQVMPRRDQQQGGGQAGSGQQEGGFRGPQQQSRSQQSRPEPQGDPWAGGGSQGGYDDPPF